MCNAYHGTPHYHSFTWKRSGEEENKRKNKHTMRTGLTYLFQLRPDFFDFIKKNRLIRFGTLKKFGFVLFEFHDQNLSFGHLDERKKIFVFVYKITQIDVDWFALEYQKNFNANASQRCVTQYNQRSPIQRRLAAIIVVVHSAPGKTRWEKKNETRTKRFVVLW